MGAGYIAVELAGVFQALGTDTTLLVRRNCALSRFDSMLREELQTEMTRAGINVLTQSEIKSITLESDGTRTLTLTNGQNLGGFDQVLMAIGRSPLTKALSLDAAGVKVDDQGYIIVDDYQQTSAKGVYAVGDVIDKHVELTPMAIAAGRRLSDRLFGGMDGAKVSGSA